MRQARRMTLVLALAACAVVAISRWTEAQQDGPSMAPVNDLPNPYDTIKSFVKLSAGRSMGSTSAVDIDKDGHSIWVAERCGANSCIADAATGQLSKLDPILHIDENGNVLNTFGAGMLVAPHGIFVDRDGNIWVTDYQANAPRAERGAGGGRGDAAAARGRVEVGPVPGATKGMQVFKFSPRGKLLLTIGQAGGAAPPACCYAPNDVLVAPNGDVFIAEGHGQGPDLILKFDKTGKFVKSWGGTGNGNGQFNQPHALAMDSQGRLFVGDRANNRVQIFDQEGKFLDVWYQFSRPSGLFIDRNDLLYSADSESGSVNPAHGGWKRGIRIGSAKSGKVDYFIPDPLDTCKAGEQSTPQAPCASGTWVAEGVAADRDGNVYGAEVGPRNVEKYAKKK